MSKFGLDGLAVMSESDAQGVRSISVALLLMAAYEEGPRTIGRRKAYVTAISGVDQTIPETELQTA